MGVPLVELIRQVGVNAQICIAEQFRPVVSYLWQSYRHTQRRKRRAA